MLWLRTARSTGSMRAVGNIRFGPVQFVAPFAKSWSLNLVGDTIYTVLAQGCGGALSGFYSMDVRDPHHTVVRQMLLSNTNTAGIWGRGGPVIGANARLRFHRRRPLRSHRGRLFQQRRFCLPSRSLWPTTSHRSTGASSIGAISTSAARAPSGLRGGTTIYSPAAQRKASSTYSTPTRLAARIIRLRCSGRASLAMT